MVDTGCPVSIGIEETAQLRAVVIRRQCGRADLLVWQRPELFLNFLRDCIDPVRRNAVVVEGLVVVERIANRESGEASVTPDFQRNRRIDEIEDVASLRCFEGIKKEGPVMPVVDSRNDYRPADAAARIVTDPALTLGRKRGDGAEPRCRIVVKEAAVQLVCAGLGDKSYLPDGADIGAVVGHIDAYLFETFDELNQRSDLCSVLARADADAVDRLVRLVSPASCKSTE